MECDGQSHPGWRDPALYEFTSHYATIAGNRVRYRDEGAGLVLLMLHGNPDLVIPVPPPDPHPVHRLPVCAVDYPSFGLSGLAAGYRFRPTMPP